MRMKQTSNDGTRVSWPVAVLLVCGISALGSSPLLAADPVAGGTSARTPLSVTLQALPSSTCVPVSSLQIDELKIDFARICPDCALRTSSEEVPGYRIVVEDPHLSWLVTVFDDRNQVLQVYQWSGGLDVGLEKAVRFLRRHQAVSTPAPFLKTQTSSDKPPYAGKRRNP
jgi:hypothetical protein